MLNEIFKNYTDFNLPIFDFQKHKKILYQICVIQALTYIIKSLTMLLINIKLKEFNY